MTQEQKELTIRMSTLYIKCLAIQRFLKEHDVNKQPENLKLKLITHILTNRGFDVVNELEKLLKEHKSFFESDEAQKVANEFSTKETVRSLAQEALTLTTEDEIKAFVTMSMKANGD